MTKGHNDDEEHGNNTNIMPNTMFRRRRPGYPDYVSPAEENQHFDHPILLNTKNNSRIMKARRLPLRILRSTSSVSKNFELISNYALGLGVIAFTLVTISSSTYISGSGFDTYEPVHLSYPLYREDFTIVMNRRSSLAHVARPFQVWHSKSNKTNTSPSYGHLEYFSLQGHAAFSRTIDVNDANLYEEKRELLIAKMNRYKLRSSYEPDEDLEDQGHKCRRNNWKSRKFPTCNAIHELVLERPPRGDVTVARESIQLQPLMDLKYLGHGHFRNAWLLKPVNKEEDDFVLKRLRLNDNFNIDYFDMNKIHREAIIMERLTASPRIVDIYSYCSTSILAEAMGSEVWRDMIPGTGYATQKELEKLQSDANGDVQPKNNFTAEEKLDMSIEMAEALADMHGFAGGTFLHGDTHPEQWLKGKDGRLVLNDFNNAEILDYYPAKNDYCKVYRSYGGFYRAPEEYDGYISESVDTFSLGNNIYCLLTGLWPFYAWSDYEYIQKKLLNQEKAYIDPRYRTRSFIEGKLVEIIEKTWEFDGEKRVSIFEVVHFLKKTKEEVQKKHHTERVT